jgi:3-oxoacyl-[acyl-carrier protein] reductase
MDLGIKGKVALVTGGSRGLGRQIALSLAREGVNVAICGRTKDTLERTAGDVRGLGVRCAAIVADASKVAEVERLHGQVVRDLGPVDILVNNVGGSGSKDNWLANMVNLPRGSWTTETIDAVPLERLREVFDRNVFCGYRLTQLCLPHMKQQRWGRIINITSIWGREFGSNIAYMAAKAALIAETKHAGVTLAKHGILVNSIAPGGIAHEDGMWERFQKENPPETVKRFIEQNLPMGRFGWPEPVGDLAAFLASERAGLITGACIVADGGQGASLI